MNIFKLFFEHDLRLDELRERQLDRNIQDVTTTIEDFMKPDPTYSKFYLAGTVLEEEKFGLSVLKQYPEIIQALSEALTSHQAFLEDSPVTIQKAVSEAQVGWPILLSEKNDIEWNREELVVNHESNIGYKKAKLAEVLKSGDLVLYKEKAHQGFDLHLFSKKNIYPKMFYPLRELVDDDFRFFSINGKKIRTERKFYFETWTLERPPHGAEEVFRDTEI
ncbi:hypothetical protein [Rhodohalobacter sp. 614A]|uniref:hypothetical protein n=1 Tax=Rhodohalobacter sp. 614A TaxID=2908649 RepID=UPI001F3A519A|nr:hypothetical protein [Rhodohalobacter sp. 614A]